ncbi:MAG: hypothetical protein WKF58_19235 [Ilumatobacteraceae bacterium]
MRDRAMIALRARDVLTEHHPLVGMAFVGLDARARPSTISVPLLFDVLAAPVRLLGDSTGAAVGAALINVVAHRRASSGAARRVGGERVAVLRRRRDVRAGVDHGQPRRSTTPGTRTCSSCRSCGSCCWPGTSHVAACAELPLAVAVGSSACRPTSGSRSSWEWCSAAALVAGIRWPLSEGGAVRRPPALAAAVGLVVWAQPIWEQLFGDGKGNLSRIFGAGSDAENIAGPTFAARAFADVLSPVSWVRPHFEKLWTGFTPHALPSERWTAVILVAAGAAAIALAVAVVRRAPGLGRLWLVFIAGCVGGYVTATAPVAVRSDAVQLLHPLDLAARRSRLDRRGASLWVLVGHRAVSADIAGCAAIAAAIGLLVMTLPTRGLATQPPSP